MSETEILNLLSTKLGELAQQLQGPAEGVWRILVHQQIIVGYTNLLLAFLCLVLAGLGFVVLIPRLMRAFNAVPGNNSGDARFGWALAIAISLVIAVAFLIAGAISGISAVQHILNPEYFALKDLLWRLN